jgi:hypothetical protein
VASVLSMFHMLVNVITDQNWIFKMIFSFMTLW